MPGPFFKRTIRFAALVPALLWISAASAATCQFNQVSGAWNVPANWNNCAMGNGVPAGTPGPADRAEITGATATLPAGVFAVSDLYLGSATIQGSGIGATTLNVVAAGTIAWGSGFYNFNGLTVNLSSTMAIPAANGPLNVTNAVLRIAGSSTHLLADTITVTGAAAKLRNEGIFTPSTSLALQTGAQFENAAGAAFTPLTPFALNAVNGVVQNQGDINLPGGITLTLSGANNFSMSGSSARLVGNGTLDATAQTLTLSAGAVDGSPIFNVGTLLNNGANLRPGGPGGMIGTITINGNYQQVKVSAMQEGKMEFDLAGIGNTDLINVSGSVTLGGSIGRGAVGTFAPPVGTVIDVVNAGSVTGSFDGGSELIVFDAPRRYVEVISATKISLRANETVWVVGSNDDLNPMMPSLRRALIEFNGEAGGGCVNTPYSIHFFLPMGQTTIQPGSPLPQINGCSGLMIDGYTQSGAAANSSATDWNGTLGVNLDGTACPGCDGIVVQAPNTVIKGINFANWTGGVRINPSGGGAQVLGNYFFQNDFGLYHDTANAINVGGPAPADRNVFVHSTTAGIASLNASGAASSFVNNLVGAGAGLAPGPNVKGIHLLNTSDATINNNIVVFNGKGIVVGTGARNALYANRINGNTTIGIDLDDDGPSPNDEAMPPYDTDSGGNQLLNFPVISSITQSGMSTGNVSFTLKSTPSSDFNVCICVNATGGNQCQQEIGCTPYSTNASGLVSGAIAATGMTPGVSTVTTYTRAVTGPKAGNSSELSPAVTFAAAAPAVSIAGSGAFPSTTVMTSSTVQAVTITNTGTGPLSITSITNSGAPTFVDTTSGPAPNAAHYCGFGSNAMGQPQTAMPINISPMGTCVLNLIFAPGATGAASGVITITSNAPGSPHTVMLSGTGLAGPPVFSPSTTVINFPAQEVGGTTAEQVLTITNTGGSALTFGAITPTATFTISSNTCTSVAPAMTCTLGLTFSPTFVGPVMGSLVINTPGAGGPHFISLNGTGTTPTTAIAPAGISHGSVTVGSSNSLNGTFTNTSPVSITLGNPFATPGAASFTITGGMVAPCTNGAVMPPMSGCTFTSTFTPAGAGMVSSTYTFSFTAGMQTFNPTVVVDGTGVAAPTPTMTVAFAPASVNTGVNSTLTITLNNPSASGASIALGSGVNTPGLSLSGLTDSCSLGAFISTGSVDLGMAGIIPAMGTCTVTVQAQSPMAGTFNVSVVPGNLITNRGNNANSSSTALTVTAAPTGPFAYIPIFTSFTGTTVSVIDLPTNTVATTITVGTGPVGAAVNAAGTRAYISNQQSNSVSVIDTATNTVVATVPVGSQPGSAAVNPAGTRVYVPNQSSNSVSVIDTASNMVTATVTGLGFPSAAVVNPAGSKVFVTLSSANAVGVIDTTSNTLIGSIPVCTGPYQPVINGSGTRVYVVCTSGNVAVIDAGSGTVLATIPVGATPRGIALTPNGAQAWTSNSGSNNVSVIDTASNTVVATLAAGTTPWGIAGNAAGTRMYVANNGSNNVSVFDTASNTVVATVPVGAGPLAIGPFLQPAAVASNPVLSRSQTAVAFGGRTTNTTSPATVVTIGNSGTANLIISGLTISGDFGFTTTCPILTPPIAPLATCTVSITFTPLTVASLAGTLTITSNAPGSPHTIALTGTGLAVAAPAIAVNTSVLNLGGTVVNTTGAQQAVIVTNTGFANLNISGITVSGAGFARVTPSTGSPVNCGTSVAPSGTCQIAVACTPAVVGTLMGMMSIAHNAIGSPTLVNLICTGNAVPVATVALSAALDFGDQVINTSSSARAVSIANTGTAPLTVSSIALTGTDSNQFAQTGVCTSVAAGASCDVLVNFAPTSIGAKSAGLIVTSNAQNAQTTNRVALSGNGVLAPRPVAVPSVTAIGFGNTIFGGASQMQLISFKNEGGLAMTISGVVATGDFTQMNNCGGSVASLASCNINVAFNPLAIGSRSGELQIMTNAQGSPHRIFLSGTGCRWFSQPGSRLFLTAC